MAQAGPRGSMDAVQQSADVEVDCLERLYLAEAVPSPAAADHLAAQGDASGPAGEEQHKQHKKRRHRAHQPEEVCGKLACAQHVERRPSAAPVASLASVDDAADASAAAAAEAAPAGPAGFLGRLLDLVPLSPRTRGIVMLNLLVLLVATNWVVVKDVGSAFDPLGFAFLRFFVAAAAFSPFMKAAAKDGRVLRAGVEIGVWTAAGYITQSLGLLTTDASRASFLSTFTVLVVPFLAGMSGKGVSAVTWASCCAALLGVGLLEQNGAPPGVGDVWSMLSAVAFGVQIFRTEHWARILGNGSNLPLMSVVLTTTMGFAALATGVAHHGEIAAALQHPDTLANMLTTAQFPWQQVLYCGLLTTDLALLMEILALQDVSSVEAAIIYTLEPVLGAYFAWALLGERLGAKGLAGAAIIVASSLATQVLGGGADQGGGGGSLGGSDGESERDEAAAPPAQQRLRPKLAGKQE
ncbi:hypothetical protein ABPG75_008724 [Micractinium tetrahymenae]